MNRMYLNIDRRSLHPWKINYKYHSSIHLVALDSLYLGCVNGLRADDRLLKILVRQERNAWTFRTKAEAVRLTLLAIARTMSSYRSAAHAPELRFSAHIQLSYGVKCSVASGSDTEVLPWQLRWISISKSIRDWWSEDLKIYTNLPGTHVWRQITSYSRNWGRRSRWLEQIILHHITERKRVRLEKYNYRFSFPSAIVPLKTAGTRDHHTFRSGWP